jgi:hypothetical protein
MTLWQQEAPLLSPLRCPTLTALAYAGWTACGCMSPTTTENPSEPPLPLPKIHKNTERTRIRAGYAKHLSRAAAELSQVLYLADKARNHGCAFVDALQFVSYSILGMILTTQPLSLTFSNACASNPNQRIDRISQTLSRDLDHHLSLTLRALVDPSTLPSTASAERARLTAELVECFKIYDALRMWREAEDVVRRELVRPFIKKVSVSSIAKDYY